MGVKVGVYGVPYTVRVPSTNTTRYSIIERRSMQCFQTTLNHSKGTLNILVFI